MKFNLSLEEMVGSKAKIRILKHLFTSEAPMSEGELAKLTKVSHMTINRLMRELQALNLVYSERAGNVYVWRINKHSYVYQALSPVIAEMSRLTLPLEHLKNLILEGLPKNIIQRSVLFGSVARGEEKAGSDIDLFIQIKSKTYNARLQPRLERLSDACLNLYGNRLAPYILTEKEAAKKKRKTLLYKIEQGIQIYP